jgi:hypothetical protein
MIQKYKEILESVAESGTNFVAPIRLLSEPEAEITQPILRHDVDFSLYGLKELAELDAKFGHQSIFLFRPDSPNYNLLGDEAFSLINYIYGTGHEVGLHIDSRSRWATEDSISIIKSSIQVPLKFISWHRPVEKDFNTPVVLFNLVNLYSEVLFNRNNYLSDSAGEWTEEKFSKLREFSTNKYFFQLLLHGEWWVHPEDLTPGVSFSYSLGKQFQIQIDSVESEVRTFQSLGIMNLLHRFQTN